MSTEAGLRLVLPPPSAGPGDRSSPGGAEEVRDARRPEDARDSGGAASRLERRIPPHALRVRLYKRRVAISLAREATISSARLNGTGS